MKRKIKKQVDVGRIVSKTSLSIEDYNTKGSGWLENIIMTIIIDHSNSKNGTFVLLYSSPYWTVKMFTYPNYCLLFFMFLLLRQSSNT